MAATEQVFSVRGVRKLEVVAGDWTAADFIAWLTTGFAGLAADQRGGEPDQGDSWAFAFEPLVFRDDSFPMGQLAAAIIEAQRAGYAWPANLRKAIVSHLEHMSLSDAKDYRLVADMWRCLAAIGAAAEESYLARKLLKRLPGDIPRNDQGAVRQLVGVFTTTLAAAPAAPSLKESFFHFVRARPNLWDDRLVVPLVNTQLSGDAGELAESWDNLRSYFGEELRRVANPDTPTGRTLTRALARSLRPDLGGSDRQLTNDGMQQLLVELGVYEIPEFNTGAVTIPRSQDVPAELRQEEGAHA